MSERKRIMVVVHPGSACGSADFNLADEAPARRDALAYEIMGWPHDILIVDGELSRELDWYGLLGLAIENAKDREDRRLVRQCACDFTLDDWPSVVATRQEVEWPGGPHEIVVTGAWYDEEENQGCVNAVASILAHHDVTVSATALRL